MGIYNSIDDKKDEFSQTETSQFWIKKDDNIKKNEIQLKKVNEIEFEYIKEKIHSEIEQKDKSIEMSNKYISINKAIDKLINTKNEKKIYKYI